MSLVHLDRDEIEKVGESFVMSIELSAKKTALTLLACAMVLWIMNALTLMLEFGYGRDFAMGFVPMFRLNFEANLPTFFSTLLLVAASLSCFAIGRATLPTDKASGLRWLTLAAIAFILSADEAAQIHELFDKNAGWAEPFFEPTGMLLEPWVVAYGFLALAVSLLFAPFILKLQPRLRNMLILAGALYVGAAIGFEMIGAVERGGSGETLRYETINSIEEMLEMTAVIIAIYALLRFGSENFGWRCITISGDQ